MANVFSQAIAGGGGEKKQEEVSELGPGCPVGKKYQVSKLSLEERFASIKLVGEECVKEEELLELLKRKQHPVAYDGFEPSGRMHIAQGILKAINVNRLTAAGCVFKFWVADWFALLNNKVGSDSAAFPSNTAPYR
ncbi:unnamed protein product [Symbiodinium sp. KB8]|nr:unnamed protein product [Symbiodinium sp. KB8]